jgi:hypothetical protein
VAEARRPGPNLETTWNVRTDEPMPDMWGVDTEPIRPEATMNLDQLLAGAAPPVLDRDAELAQEIREMIVAAEDSAHGRRTRRRRYVATVLCAISVVLGAGGVAAATDVLPSWLPWTTSSGTSCELAITAELRRDANGHLATDRTDANEQRQVLAAANRFIAAIDLDGVDMAKAEDDWFDYLERVSVQNPSRDTLEREFVGDDLETHALIYAVDQRVTSQLASEGYDPNVIMLTVANGCGR